MGALRTILVDGGGQAPRWLKFLGLLARQPWELARLPNLRHWSQRTVIALVMQTREGDADPRPQLGAAYQPVAAVPPARPAVPVGAPGALA
jgi:cholesterol oxidase